MKGKDSGNDGVGDGQFDIDPVVVSKDPMRRVSGVHEIGSLSYYKRMLLCEEGVREDLSPLDLEADEKIIGLISAVLFDGATIDKFLFPFVNNDKGIQELLSSVLVVRRKMMHALIYTMESGGEIQDRLEAIYAVTEYVQSRLEEVLCHLSNGRTLPSIFTLAEDDEPTTRRSA